MVRKIGIISLLLAAIFSCSISLSAQTTPLKSLSKGNFWNYNVEISSFYNYPLYEEVIGDTIIQERKYAIVRSFGLPDTVSYTNRNGRVPSATLLNTVSRRYERADTNTLYEFRDGKDTIVFRTGFQNGDPMPQISRPFNSAFSLVSPEYTALLYYEPGKMPDTTNLTGNEYWNIVVGVGSLTRAKLEFARRKGIVYVAYEPARSDLSKRIELRGGKIDAHQFGAQVPVAVNDAPSTPIALQVFPQPATTGLLQFLLRLHEPTPITARLFNILGQKVLEQHVSTVASGEYFGTLDVQHLVQGRYLLHIETNSGVQVSSCLVR